MFVKPGTGPSPDDPKEKITFKVRDPATRRHIPADGAEVPDTGFWRRLLRDGDVVAAEPPVEVEPKGAPATLASTEGKHDPALAEAAEHDAGTKPQGD